MPRARPKVTCPSCQGHKYVATNKHSYQWTPIKSTAYRANVRTFYRTMSERLSGIKAKEYPRLICGYTTFSISGVLTNQCPYGGDSCGIKDDWKTEQIVEWLYNHNLAKRCDTCNAKGKIHAYRMVELALKEHFDSEDTD